MSVSRINIDDTLTLISLGLPTDEVEENDVRCDDTIELDKVIEEVKKHNERKN